MSIIDDIKLYLNIDESNVENDKLIEFLDEESDEIIKAILGQEYITTTATIGFYGDGRNIYHIKVHPVSSVSKLEFLDTTGWEEISSSSYLFEDEYLILYYYFDEGQPYRVTLVYGYDTIPELIKLVKLEICGTLHKEIKQGLLNYSTISENFQGTSTSKTFRGVIDNFNRWSKILAKYKVR